MKLFFDTVRAEFGPLTQQQVLGLALSVQGIGQDASQASRLCAGHGMARDGAGYAILDAGKEPINGQDM